MGRALLDFTPRRILVCQQRQLGDVLLMTPALELLAARFPQAEVDVLTEKKCLPMLAHNPHVHRVWALDKCALPTLWHELRWYRAVTRQRYDMVVNFQPTLPRLRWVVGFSRASVRLTTPLPWYLRPLYTHVVSVPPIYAAAAKAAVLAPLGIRWQGERPRLYLTAEERADAAQLLAKLGLGADERLISLDPTHRQPTRRWPLAHYARLVALLCRKADAAGMRLRFLPLWGPGEDDDIRTLTQWIQREGCANRLLLPRDMLSLRASAACMERAALHIGNCSAPRHIAVAVGTPSCVAQGSTGPEWICPPRDGAEPDHLGLFAGLPCQPCERNHCDRLNGAADAPCLVALEPARMAETAWTLLQAPGRN